MKRTIALVTDFGLNSAYSGIMKGVIWSINPEANIADLSHGIELGDIAEACYILIESIEFFPAGTVFVGVIDPGVGSSRRIIAIDYSDRIILVPDNGLAAAIFNRIAKSGAKLYTITKNEYYLDKVSNTFHGRDIFAPVAAWISLGVELKNMGEEIEANSLHYFDLPEITILGDGFLEGQIVRIDGFGNLVTNISGNNLKNPSYFRSLLLVDNGIEIHSISDFYALGKEYEPIALVGSSGFLEIAVNNSSAEKRLSMGKGSKVLLCLNNNNR